MEDLVVKTTAGKVRGSKQKSFEGTDYYSFKGIPYAKPPVEELRFKDPQPLEPWTGIREATSHGPICPQAEFGTGKIVGSDDCLYLNVYTKALEPKKLPVMVWIYGGAFICGSGDDDWYGPDYLMDKDIVLVTFNYRLGVLGFLNMEDEVAPGNQGLKDQAAVLKWVNQNIEAFGGDSNNVTVFGQSAGSVSVHYLVLSPLSRDLFHKAIMQSGSILCPAGRLTKNPSKYAYKLCEVLGENFVPQCSKTQVVEFLRKIDCEKLIKAQNEVTSVEEKIQGIFPFGPGIDSGSENPIMKFDPVDAAKDGFDKPLLIGYTNREGILHGEHVIARIKPQDMVAKDNFERYVHPNLENKIKEEYGSIENFRNNFFEKADPNAKDLDEDELIEKIVDFISNNYYEKPISEVVKTQSRRSNTFFYQYNYDKTLSPIKRLLKSKLKGACHIDEVQHIFRMKVFDPPNTVYTLQEESPDFCKLRRQMIEWWTNFALSGKPVLQESTCQWKQLHGDNLENCMIIDGNTSISDK